jgi:hypothetical protein
MLIQKITGCAAAAAIAAFMSVGATEAAIVPAVPHAAPSFHLVDCAVGLHIDRWGRA